uniref:Uncharacterized protein n=1 Tax=Rhizophora mucronata TaxID=61149 RepID=A0A2P2PXE0_RHIMU
MALPRPYGVGASYIGTPLLLTAILAKSHPFFI